MFEVNIGKLKVHARIGVFVAERSKPQPLFVTLKFSYKVNSNNNVDNIANLKSYSEIKHFLKEYIKYSKYKTLEKLIIECSNALQKKFNIENVFIKIEKPEIAKKYGCKSISVSK